jgi:hypothetical protein
MQAEYFTVAYSATEGGSISGETKQSVESGGDSMYVTAVPDTGYAFVGWSDGSESHMRRETGVTENLTFSASFRQITAIYSAGTGGFITGNISQDVEYGNDAETVTAIPETGYRFVKWSDGKGSGQI